MHVVILADPWLRARHPHALRYSLCCAIWIEPKWLESKWLEPKWLEPKWLEPKSETVGSRCATEPTTTIFEKKQASTPNRLSWRRVSRSERLIIIGILIMKQVWLKINISNYCFCLVRCFLFLFCVCLLRCFCFFCFVVFVVWWGWSLVSPGDVLVSARDGSASMYVWSCINKNMTL